MSKAGAMIPSEANQILRLARQHQRDGRLEEAAALCRGILSRQPRHAAALNVS